MDRSVTRRRIQAGRNMTRDEKCNLTFSGGESHPQRGRRPVPTARAFDDGASGCTAGLLPSLFAL